MRVPDLTRKHVLKFCRSISKSDPVHVPLRPLPGKEINDCINIVKEHVLMNGGIQHFGWAIWERPKVFIEAELHTVWETPNGEFIDISPKPVDIDSVVFLPDRKIKYRGRQIDNIRKALVKNRDVERYLSLFSELFTELNKGHLADYYGPIVMTERIGQLQQEMQYLQVKIDRKYGPA